jgi:hypothetical protein
LLRNVPISASTYAYVNPVIAVALGMSVYDESLSAIALGARRSSSRRWRRSCAGERRQIEEGAPGAGWSRSGREILPPGSDSRARARVGSWNRHQTRAPVDRAVHVARRRPHDRLRARAAREAETILGDRYPC